MWLLLLTLLIQEPLLLPGNTEPQLRVNQIRAERRQKVTNGFPDEPTDAERHLVRMQRLIRRSPVRLSVRGLGAGAGLALGSTINWHTAGERVNGTVWGTASMHRFYSAGTRVQFEKLTGSELSISLEASHADAPQLEYYGTGPASSLDNRTNFRREDTLFGVGIALHPARVLRHACRVSELLLNVGPGQNKGFASSELIFGPREAVGIDVQSDFLIAGCSAEIDMRDFAEDPHHGTFGTLAYNRHVAHDDERFSFHRVSAVAEHYIPFFNRKRVIAVRAATELSFHSDDQAVPFYLQPTLGSDRTLRGFRRYRFYDENSLAFNSEYLWEINTGFDMAVFADFGKVFQRPGDISLSGMEAAAGFGLRFKGRRSVVARLDTGFSREGVQVWLTFGSFF
jgi:hypothetical protein